VLPGDVQVVAAFPSVNKIGHVGAHLTGTADVLDDLNGLVTS